MSVRFSALLALGLVTALPAAAFALPHTVFAVHPGRERDVMPDGTIPQAVVTLVMSNSDTACEDWRSLAFRPNHQYMLIRLAAVQSGDGLTGCYETLKQPSGAKGCAVKRGSIDGLDFMAAAAQQNAGRAKNARFITGGHVKIDDLAIYDDGTGHLKGFANVLLGDTATGGVIEADWCDAGLPPQP